MRVYLNRFLNIPPVPLPKQTKRVERSINADDSMSKDPEALLREELLSLLDKQQQVNQTGQLVIDYIIIMESQTASWLQLERPYYEKIVTFILSR
jgi:hypothetical protein